MSSYSKIWTFIKICERLQVTNPHMHLNFRPWSAYGKPVRFELCRFHRHSRKPEHARACLMVSACEKAIFMPLDIERYRGELAPLNLSKEKEDELILDLYKIMETLVDHMQDPNFYPLYYAVAKEAIDSLEDAIAVQSEKNEKEQEAT